MVRQEFIFKAYIILSCFTLFIYVTMFRNIYSRNRNKKKNREEFRVKKEEKGKKGGGNREEKKGILVKKEGKYPYFVSLFNIHM